MDFEVEGLRPRGRPKKPRSEVMEKIARPEKDAMDRRKWRKLIKEVV